METMSRKPTVRILAAVLALSALVPALPGPTLADDSRGRHRHHDRDYDRYRDRDRYIEEYYQRNGDDDDYRRWQRDRRRWDDREYQRWYNSRRHDHDDDDNRKAMIAGLFGLAAGAVIGGALSQSGSAAPAPAYSGQAPVYSGSPEWYQYCASRYRSFNPQTGMYRGYDGQLRPCR